MEATQARDVAAVTLVFGPQTLSFSEEWFYRLRTSINSHRHNHWMRKAVQELPHYVELFQSDTQGTAHRTAAALLRSISEWLDTDATVPYVDNLSSAVLTPLVILDHLCQYSQFVEVANSGSDSTVDPWSCLFRPLKVLGFCTGFLSALAIASSNSQAEFESYGTIAVRLGALIGAVVDAADPSPSGSLTAVWSTPEQKQKLDSTLAQDAESYISVDYDENRATITTTSEKLSHLIRVLKDDGIVAYEIGLRGRYHWDGHRQTAEHLTTFCDAHSELQFREAKDNPLSLPSTTTAEEVSYGKLHHVAIRDILVERCHWFSTYQHSVVDQLQDAASSILVFGEEKCVPPSILRHVHEHVKQMTDRAEATKRISALACSKPGDCDDDIAVVGMACKVAGADDLDELWEIMCRGESQHVEVPQSRVSFESQWRGLDDRRKWYGNFLRDPDAYDHKFFRKSPIEAASQDPQQRLFLQSAYQAVEQSGYFNNPDPDRRVGVFAGVGAVDYETNVACHPANAYSATGNLRAFITGKVSHYFGWSGPSLTVDTACSGSAVAIHQACRSILSGECTAALAGGVNIIASPLWFQNLAGASFLSPTGACKPFDAAADGYCRGEAVACVFLKKMSQAVQDGDTILGRIRSTAVSQNDNCTPITVPNAPSLSTLFGDVITKAHLTPEEITLVEAHGTGTPIGDPAEYESVRRALGGRARRSAPLHLGSVKGLLGHTESASGVVALIKVLLALHHGYIAPQASFKSLSPGLKATPDDMITVGTHLKPWDAAYRAALINNYGAAGSNASMIISQAHPSWSKAPSVSSAGELFWITGADERALRAYCLRLRDLIKSQRTTEVELLLADISYSLARQSNRTLPLGLIFRSSSILELESKLSSFVGNGVANAIVPKKAYRPVILCFGGQTSQTIGLDRNVYGRYGLLRNHLDTCNKLLLSMGCDSIYPTIFEKLPMTDVVKLQTTLFSFQYSCAKCWIEVGLPITAVIGHSFGELTAMCISGMVSLREALRIIAARARLVKQSWGVDKGAMIAIEAELSSVHDLLRRVHTLNPSEDSANIACFNGPQNFTLAGSTAAIKALETTARTMPGLRCKIISVANAYHSSLVDPLKHHLATLRDDILFTRPRIHWERATEAEQNTNVRRDFFATHMREPVYFNNAAQRLHKKFPSAIWLEAGSNSTITNLASQALGRPQSSHFQSLNICHSNGSHNMIDHFADLWKAGLASHHWGHHASQSRLYDVVLLPPYQFEKSRHWLEVKKPSPHHQGDAMTRSTNTEELPTELYTFVGYQDSAKSHARFRVNTMIKKYEDLVSGHVIANTAAICPATVQLDIVVEALLSLGHDLGIKDMQPEISDVTNQAPVCINPARALWVDLKLSSVGSRMWQWEMSSTASDGSHKTSHVKGSIAMRPTDDQKYANDFARYGRLMNHRRCTDLLQCKDPDDIVQGRNIYKIFCEIVDYTAQYQNLRKIVGKDNMSAGRINKERSDATWLDAHLTDCFCQVAGFWVNSMTERNPTEMYIAAGFESWLRAPSLPSAKSHAITAVWDVMAIHNQAADKSYTTDIFVYDAEQGTLCEVVLGMRFMRVPKAVMVKTLSQLSAAGSSGEVAPPSHSKQGASLSSVELKHNSIRPVASQAPAASNNYDAAAVAPASTEEARPGQARARLLSDIAEILSELTGVDEALITPAARLADIGIDSLMSMEISRAMKSSFKISYDIDQLAEADTVEDVVDAVAAAVGTVALEGSASFNGVVESHHISSARGMDDVDSPTFNTPYSATSDTFELSRPYKHQHTSGLSFSQAILEAFSSSRTRTDQFIEDFGCSAYLANVQPKQIQLCVVLIIEAFEQLGCSLSTANGGEPLHRIPHVPQHERYVDFLYGVLEADAHLVNLDGGMITRTNVSVPTESSKVIFDELIATFPDHELANRLTYHCGGHIAEILRGETNGVKVIFGSDEGRSLVSGFYSDSPLFKMYYTQMQDILRRLISRMPDSSAPLKVLELGAGTGGTTNYLVPLLAELGVPVEYTFTDIAPSFIAAARKKYKAYSFMRFATHDIEKAPSDDLMSSQHLVVASNAVHATHSLSVSLSNIHKLLRPDGFLLLLELTDQQQWLDLIFGLLEGWWLFDDGRSHALSSEKHWERELHAAGYGHVDWTDGHYAENRLQRITIATASGPQHNRDGSHKIDKVPENTDDITARRLAVDEYVKSYSHEFIGPTGFKRLEVDNLITVLVTGGTGSVGSHVVAHLLTLPHITKVICLNREIRGAKPDVRQIDAFADHRIGLSIEHLSKLQVLQGDTATPMLGLTEEIYEDLVSSVTHVLHNAWPMSYERPLHKFEPQFFTMRNLIDLCNDAGAASSRVITFQFISSIAVVGHHPFLTGQSLVPEQQVQIESVLPMGYGDAKYVCETLLDTTLGRHQSHFRAMSVRLGQVAGSSTSGYWNTQEHLSFLVKSSHTLRCLPDFDGVLSWTPVDQVAGTLSDLILQNVSTPYQIYHIDNPVRQPWRDMVSIWASALDISQDNIVSYSEWASRVRHFSGPVKQDNPAHKLIDFLDQNFFRMSCGGLLLDTTHAREHSPTLAAVESVNEKCALGYIAFWRDVGFLS
ncbi:hypothetical protein LTR86_007640 [Recurvomyces mirabilis]|nr:hypothetical protein LTR86_007640 [Recurvomyces mirabilis]